MRLTPSTPDRRQISTAADDQAVSNSKRGPNSSTVGWLPSMKLAGPNRSGSNVSASR